jgi:hypothetical protein
MKRLFMLFAALSLLYVVNAQETIGNLFKEMPDSVLPTLTRNNRLDLLDFWEAKMRAEITNKFERSSELETLSTDSMLIRMNEASDVSFLLLDLAEPVDSSMQVICMVHTYHLAFDKGEERTITYYSAKWRKLSTAPKLSEKSEERVKKLPSSTILKEDNSLLEKPLIL